MKEKHILRITLLAVLLCMMTILCATADELDAKIIRWDGTGNVAIASITNGFTDFLNTSEVDGNLRVTGSSAETYKGDNYFYLNIATSDYVDIYTYPYYVIKYKTNDKQVATGKNTQVYFCVTKDGTKKDHAYYYNAACYSGTYDFTDMWRTYLFHFGTDQSDVDCQLNGLSTDNYGENTVLRQIRIAPARDTVSAEAFDGIQMDIEFIGFFKTIDDADKYARSSVQIRFDGDENRAAVKPSTGTVTESGTLLLPIKVDSAKNSDTYGAPSFTFAQGSNLPTTTFTLTDFPYALLSIKATDEIPNLQFYHGNNGGWIFFSPATHVGLNAASEGYDFEKHTMLFKDEYKNYTALNSGKVDGLVVGKTQDPFMQFKGFTTGSAVDIDAEIEYIAYFRTEGEMQAYESGIAEKVNTAYKAIANAEFSVEASSEDAIKDNVESRIGTLLGTDSGVTVTVSDVAYTVYDNTATAMVTVSADYDYTGLDGEAHTYTESKKVGITIDVDYLYDFKVIRWNESGKPVVNSTEKTYSVKKAMPANTAYTQGSTWQPTFSLGEDAAFALADYPYVSIKLRTNYPATVQFYAASKMVGESRVYNFFWLAGGDGRGSIGDGKWHVLEKDFGTVDNDIMVSEPFFQFKVLTQTPDGDLFAEIDSIRFFKSEADAKHYDFNESSKVIVNGSDLYAAVASSTSASLNDDGSLRLTTTNKSLSTFRIKNVFKGADGNNLDLYEYPYVKIRFKSDYKGNVQAYMLGTDDYYWYTPIGNKNSNTDGEWHEALISFNCKDGAASTSTSYGGYTWTVGTPDKSITRIGNLPTSSWLTGGYMFHINGGSADGYLDVDYIAFYKTKEEAMADTVHADDLAIANSDLAIVEGKSYSYTLHQAIGEIAIENYVRTTVEEAVENVSVAANANSFTYGDAGCTVKVTLSYGTATVYKNITVALYYLDEITLESLGAQIRPIGEEGLKADLRFGAKVKYDDTVYSDVTYGMVVSPVPVDNTTYKFEKISTAANQLAGSKKGADGKFLTAVVVEAENAYDIDGESYKIFTAVVTGIPDGTGTDGVNAYDTKIVARPYITYKLDGTEYTVYGDEMVRTVNEVLAASGISTEVSKDATWKND